MTVKIMCDTTCDLSVDQAKDLEIEMIPLKVHFSDEDHTDGTLLSKAEFFKKMRECIRLPVTSQINPQEFRQAFTQALKHHDEVVLLTISAGLSGTYNAAVLARANMGADKERIFVLDSKQTSFTLALLVREACAMVRQGMRGAEIIASLEEVRSRTKFTAVFGSMDNLRKGGRLPAAVAWVGNALNIKPAVTLRDGHAALTGKVRGGRQKVISWLIEQAEKEGADLVSHPLAVAYAEDIEDAKEMIAALAQKSVDTIQLLVIQIGAVIATHVGDKGLGIGFICPKPALEG